MVRLFILLANICLPVAAITLALQNPDTSFRWLFVVALVAHLSVRMWETYFTSKEPGRSKFEGDWTLIAATFAYIAMMFLLTFEFFLGSQQISGFSFVAGAIIYALGTRMRWWGVKTLGSQWAIHAVGKQKIEKKRLLKIGPFQFVRHPIYTGIMLDQLAIPLLASTPIALLFVALINTPVMLIRLRMEEKQSLTKFGPEYAEYGKTTGAILPTKNLREFFEGLFLFRSKTTASTIAP